MTVLSTLYCQCADCPGANCPCGCQADATPPATQLAGLSCTCASRCGCDAAEQGCLCSPPQA